MSKPLPLPQSPSGFMGKLFGKLMEWTNVGAYKIAIATLAPAPNECYLELGFRTGRFAEMLLLAYPDIFVAGLDPTPTMVQTAIDRLTNLGLSDRIDLREGSDASLPWHDNKFDAIIAIHCFQFWQDPDRSMDESLAKPLCKRIESSIQTGGLSSYFAIILLTHPIGCPIPSAALEMKSNSRSIFYRNMAISL